MFISGHFGLFLIHFNSNEATIGKACYANIYYYQTQAVVG